MISITMVCSVDSADAWVGEETKLSAIFTSIPVFTKPIRMESADLF